MKGIGWPRLPGASKLWQLSWPHPLGEVMLGIPRRYSHFVFGVIQAGLTSLIAAGIASVPFMAQGEYLSHWLASWLISWGAMFPIVLFAAPAIRALSVRLTTEEPKH
jgi:Protein of unknown function (DUF2798)